MTLSGHSPIRGCKVHSRLAVACWKVGSLSVLRGPGFPGGSPTTAVRRTSPPSRGILLQEAASGPGQDCSQARTGAFVLPLWPTLIDLSTRGDGLRHLRPRHRLFHRCCSGSGCGRRCASPCTWHSGSSSTMPIGQARLRRWFVNRALAHHCAKDGSE